DYLFQFLHSNYFYRQILWQSQGSAQPNFGPTHLKRVNILLPGLAEQIKIAIVLSACDREISLLGQKLDALQRQKKGLMRQLLTGRVRAPL
ncbi:MAG: restriction endonuclease subunit S, partial [Anaerolineae bacterium]|nr:restriction endonuclease subunit S [Anaerolineae bacterium]